MKKISTLLILSITLLITSFNCGANEQFLDLDERLYILPEQVLLTNEGIFLNLNDRIYSIHSLCTDSQGIYVPRLIASKALGDCPNGHSRRCPSCHGCKVADCPHRCKCR